MLEELKKNLIKENIIFIIFFVDNKYYFDRILSMIINIMYLFCVEQQQNNKNPKPQNSVKNLITLQVLDKLREIIYKKNEYITQNNQQNNIDIQAQRTKLETSMQAIVKELNQKNQQYIFYIMFKQDNSVNQLFLSESNCIEQTQTLSNQLQENHETLVTIAHTIGQIENSNISNIQDLYSSLCEYFQVLQEIAKQSKDITKTIQNNDSRICAANMRSCTITSWLQQQPKQSEQLQQLKEQQQEV